MSTSSTISIQNEDGTVSGIYCHYDGMLSHNGKILVEKYDTADRAHALIQLGNLSALREEVGEKHSYHTANPLWCIAYGRDREEDDQEAQTVQNLGLYMDEYRESYNYHFKDGEWWLVRGQGLKLVREML